MPLADRLICGDLEALDDPALGLELLGMPNWWPRAAAVCADKVRAELKTVLVYTFPPGSPEATLLAGMSWALDPEEPSLQRARRRLDQAYQAAALGPRNCDLALRALATLDRLVP